MKKIAKRVLAIVFCVLMLTSEISAVNVFGEQTGESIFTGAEEQENTKEGELINTEISQSEEIKQKQDENAETSESEENAEKESETTENELKETPSEIDENAESSETEENREEESEAEETPSEPEENPESSETEENREEESEAEEIPSEPEGNPESSETEENREEESETEEIPSEPEENSASSETEENEEEESETEETPSEAEENPASSETEENREEESETEEIPSEPEENPESSKTEENGEKESEMTEDVQEQFQNKFETKVNDVSVCVTLNEAVLAGTELIVTPITVTEEMEQSIRFDLESKQKKNAGMTAYRFSFVKDNVQVTPKTDAFIEISMPQKTAEDTFSVYRFENETQASELAAELSDSAIAFWTDCFGEFVIVNHGDNMITVTMEYFNCTKYDAADENAAKLYDDAVFTAVPGSKITDYKMAANWEIDHIRIDDTRMSLEEAEDTAFFSDTTVKVFYQPKDAGLIGDIFFYEYDARMRGVSDFNGTVFLEDAKTAGALANVTVKDGYRLKFLQSGDSYSLEAVISPQAEEETVPDFFGIRCDAVFTIGDYAGDLEFVYNGKNALRVLLDGEKELLNFAGSETDTPFHLNLWDFVEDKISEHTLTILYLQQGESYAAETMSFALPNVRIASVADATAVLEFNKVDTSDMPLADAEFLLVNDTSGKEIEAVSDADGKVRMEALTEGTYVLSEVLAPDGYVKSEKTWKVDVRAVDKSGMTALLYEMDGVTPLAEKKIVNHTILEFLQTGVETNKTAKLTDWEKREYQIDITASSLVTSQTTIETPQTVDAMLVFDLSGSMNKPMSGKSELKNVGKFSEVKDQLNTNQVYYWNETGRYGNSTAMGTSSISDNSYAKYPVKYLNGTWKKYVNNSWSAVADKDIISTWDSRLTALKNAVSGFVTGIAKTSPESLVGMASFYGIGNSYSSTTTGALNEQLAKVNETKLLETVNAMFADGGTAPQKGLNIAAEQLKNAADENEKYVILFTDGEPLEGYTDHSKASEESAKALKAAGYTVITIGLGLTNDTAAWLSEKIASENCAFTADSAEELNKIFQTIQSTITQSKTLTGVQVTDVIDAAFSLADGEKERLQAEGAVVTERADGTTVITWANQEVKAKENETSGFSKTIKIVAKEETIGGNNLHTNVLEDSFFSYGGGTLLLPQPSVNVKIEYELSDSQQMIFLGESLNEYADSAMEEIKAGQSDISLKIYADKKCETEISYEQLKEQTPQADCVYYVNGFLQTEPASEQSNANCTINGVVYQNETHVLAKLKENEAYAAQYEVGIKTGTLTLIKKISKNAVKHSEGDPIFTFKITNETTGEIFYKTLRFGTDSEIDDGTQIEEGFFNVKAQTVLTGLAQGIYKIEELETMGFSLKSFSAVQPSNCDVFVSDNAIKAAVGLLQTENSNWDNVSGFASAPEDGHLNADTAAVLAVNQKTRQAGKLTDTDAVKNQFVINDEAKKVPSVDNNYETDVRD